MYHAITQTTLSLVLIAMFLALGVPANRAAAGTVSRLISTSNCASSFVSHSIANPNSFVPSREIVFNALCKRAASQFKQYV